MKPDRELDGGSWEARALALLTRTRLPEAVHVRRAGVGTVMGDRRSGLDEWLAALGFRVPPEGWTPLSRDEAVTHLDVALTTDMAYKLELSASLASEVADVLAELGVGATCFTNMQPFTRAGVPCSYASSPITDATFDTGIAVVAADCFALLWVMDED